MLAAACVFVCANDMPLLVDADGSPARRAGYIDNLESAVAVKEWGIGHGGRSGCEVEPAGDPPVVVDPIKNGLRRGRIINRNKVVGDWRVQFLGLISIRGVSLPAGKMGGPGRTRSRRMKQGV